MKRKALGIAVMLTTVWGLGHVSELLGVEHYLSAIVLSGIIFGAAALVGGFVARYGFVPLALLMWLIVWAVIVYVLYQIAEPTGQVSITSILSYNLATLLVSLIAACGGAATGQHFSRRFTHH